MATKALTKKKVVKKATKKKFVYTITIPKSGHLKNSKKIFQRSVDAVNNFYDTYSDGTPGAPTHQKQDLLRATVIFACAGLDSILKTLVEDCLEEVINQSEGAEKSFKDFIEKRIKNKNHSSRNSIKQKEENPFNDFDYSFLSSILCSSDPRTVLLEKYKKNFSGSLQSAEEVFRVGAAFELETKKIIEGTSEADFKKAFEIRNKITHELDITLKSTDKWDTKKRTVGEITKSCESVFQVIQNFLNELEKKVEAKKHESV
ncbi:MAG: HEPN domain-containing protein [Patescibacteria group bacterium]|mgnify:CR=1 FL=1